MTNTRIIPFLYEGITVDHMIKLYADSLRHFPATSDDFLHANMLEHFSAITGDRSFCNSVHTLMTSFYYEICENYRIYLKGRKKSLINVEDKCNMQIYRQNLDPTYSAQLNDSLAFRIIVYGKSEEESRSQCYELMDKCISFFFRFGFTPIRAEPIFDISEEIPSNLYIPSKSQLSPSNQRFVKDYIINPKTNGYQSLHILFADNMGRIFEVQIRTVEMDALAEKGLADHCSYKSRKYKKHETQKEANTPVEKFEKVDTTLIDINKIKAEAFILTGNPKAPYHDCAGILSSRTFLEISNF